MMIRAPIRGQVQQLAVHAIGGVVQPAQELMRVVPADDELQVEAFLQNKDIGLVQTGRAAEVKIEAFPFTKYGVVEGRVVDISTDAIQDENAGLIYAARFNDSKENQHWTPRREFNAWDGSIGGSEDRQAKDHRISSFSPIAGG